jgi:hypothetical protein
MIKRFAQHEWARKAARAGSEGEGALQMNGETARTKPGFFTNCLVVVGTLVLCLAILEIGLRATGRYRIGSVGGFWEEGGVSYRLKGNVSKRIEWPSMSFTVHTDDLGFRYKRPGPRQLGVKPYWAVLGSSEVFGNGLDYEQTFIGVLSEKLERDGIDVVNMGVGGHHLLEQKSLFEAYASSATSQPHKVILVLNPLFIGGYDDIHENTTIKMGELFPNHNWRVPLAKRILSDLSADYRFFRDKFRNAQTRYFADGDFSLSFYVERYSKKHPIRTAEKTEDFLRHMRDLEQRIRGLGATPVCVWSPAVGGFLLNKLKAEGKLDGNLFDTEFFVAVVQRHCAAEGIQFVNLEPLLQKMYDRGEKLNFDADAHFNGPTSRVIGEYLYDALKPKDAVTSTY